MFGVRFVVVAWVSASRLDLSDDSCATRSQGGNDLET